MNIFKKVDKIYNELFYVSRSWSFIEPSEIKEKSTIDNLKEDIKSLEEEIDKLHEYLGVNRQKNCTDKLVKKTKK